MKGNVSGVAMGVLMLGGFMVTIVDEAKTMMTEQPPALIAVLVMIAIVVLLKFIDLLRGVYGYPVFSQKRLKDMQSMDPRDFEFYVADLLKKRGYTRVKVTPATNDMGKDITCYDHHGNKVVVEVKRYADHNTIGRPLIQKLHSCMIHEQAERAIFVTTSTFNQNAIDYSKGKAIELVDGRKLNSWAK